MRIHKLASFLFAIALLNACTGSSSNENALVQIRIEKSSQVNELGIQSVGDASASACYLVHAYSLYGDSRLNIHQPYIAPEERWTPYGPRALGVVIGLFAYGDLVELEIPPSPAVKIDLIALHKDSNGIIDGTCREKVSASIQPTSQGPHVRLVPAYDNNMRVLASGVVDLLPGQTVEAVLRESLPLSGGTFPSDYPDYRSASKMFVTAFPGHMRSDGVFMLPTGLASFSNLQIRCPPGAAAIKVYQTSGSAVSAGCSAGLATAFTGSVSSPSTSTAGGAPATWKLEAWSGWTGSVVSGSVVEKIYLAVGKD